jgi:hypothetical protein
MPIWHIEPSVKDGGDPNKPEDRNSHLSNILKRSIYRQMDIGKITLSANNQQWTIQER